MSTIRITLALALLALATGCGATKKFEAVPASIDKATVPQQKIEMTAQKYFFTPEEIRVKQGTLVTIEAKSTEGTHGLGIPAFGINELLPEGEMKTVQFFAAEKGEYEFKCTHFCGLGHLGMNGTIIVE